MELSLNAYHRFLSLADMTNYNRYKYQYLLYKFYLLEVELTAYAYVFKVKTGQKSFFFQ
jgi:hypothetical protein